MTAYTYDAFVVRVVDGDTIDLVVVLQEEGPVDYGFRVKGSCERKTFSDRFRLVDFERGVDCPERGQVGWSEAKSFVEAMLPVGTEVVIHTQHPKTRDPRDGFGRWLATVMVDGVSVGAALLENNLAKVWTA